MPSLLFSALLLALLCPDVGVLATSFASPDFIIVGGGTAGCVIAARLCDALPSAKIVLLERGLERNEEADFLVRAPRNTIASSVSPLLSELFESNPDPGLLSRKNFVATGNTLGGSSSINGMQWSIPIGDAVDRFGILGLSTKVAQTFYRRAYSKVGFAPQPRSLQ